MQTTDSAFADHVFDLFGEPVPVLHGVLEKEIVPDVENKKDKEYEKHRKRCRDRFRTKQYKGY